MPARALFRGDLAIAEPGDASLRAAAREAFDAALAAAEGATGAAGATVAGHGPDGAPRLTRTRVLRARARFFVGVKQDDIARADYRVLLTAPEPLDLGVSELRAAARLLAPGSPALGAECGLRLVARGQEWAATASEDRVADGAGLRGAGERGPSPRPARAGRPRRPPRSRRPGGHATRRHRRVRRPARDPGGARRPVVARRASGEVRRPRPGQGRLPARPGPGRAGARADPRG